MRDWVDKKYNKPNKLQLLHNLGEGNWSKEFAVHKVKYQEEIELIRRHGIKILYLSDILKESRTGKMLIKGALGADLLDLMSVGAADDRVLDEVVEAANRIEF